MTKRIIFVSVLMITVWMGAVAQPGPGGPGGGDPGPGRPVPITGIELLLLAGGVLGARKLMRTERNK